MFKLPMVSVVIVNYNGADFITECIDSVLQSDYPNFEILVVENGSTDASLKILMKKYQKIEAPRAKSSRILRDFIAEIPRSEKTINRFIRGLRSHRFSRSGNKKIKIIESSKNLFFCEGSNLGAKHAKGEYLIFLNSDTVVDRNWIKELVKCNWIDKKKLIQPKILFFNEKDIIDNVGGVYTFFGFGFGKGRGQKDRGQYDKVEKIDFVNGTCFMINWKFFWKLGGFDKEFNFFYEDVDLSLRAREYGGTSLYCPKSIIYHKSLRTYNKKFDENFLKLHVGKNRIRVVQKNFSGLEKYLRLAFIFFVHATTKSKNYF